MQDVGAAAKQQYLEPKSACKSGGRDRWNQRYKSCANESTGGKKVLVLGEDQSGSRASRKRCKARPIWVSTVLMEIWSMSAISWYLRP